MLIGAVAGSAAGALLLVSRLLRYVTRPITELGAAARPQGRGQET